MRSAAPAVDAASILLPGQREFETMAERQRNGIPLADEVWQQLCAVAAELEMELSDE
jgi:LDH2 family malate/lactate/ureidoglycolate dehydrogenase